jgi:general stress protein YciG
MYLVPPAHLEKEGGKKGGPARSEALSAAKRSEIARKGGNARQGKKTW